MDTLWLAMISSGSAIVGVIATQLFQLLNSRAAWQREEGRLEIEWRREDRVRFADLKRSSYAELLTLTNAAYRFLERIDKRQGGGHATAADRDGIDQDDLYLPWVTTDLLEDYETLYNEFESKVTALRMVAPEHLCRMVDEMFEEWDVTSFQGLTRSVTFGQISSNQRKLAALMREDLEDFSSSDRT